MSGTFHDTSGRRQQTSYSTTRLPVAVRSIVRALPLGTLCAGKIALRACVDAAMRCRQLGQSASHLVTDLLVGVCKATSGPCELLSSCYRAREAVAEVLLSDAVLHGITAAYAKVGVADGHCSLAPYQQRRMRAPIRTAHATGCSSRFRINASPESCGPAVGEEGFAGGVRRCWAVYVWPVSCMLSLK